ncbi:hypothetical protein SDJN02_04453, partial [Cucurbita argyrosperma subsp. argyrosperma]
MADSKNTPAGGVKVVLIEYHHVHTDVSSFKSVVQTLTGKHSSAVEGGGGTCRKRPRVEVEKSYMNRTASFLHSTSFKDLDRFLNLHLPALEDLNWIWAD